MEGRTSKGRVFELADHQNLDVEESLEKTNSEQSSAKPGLCAKSVWPAVLAGPSFPNGLPPRFFFPLAFALSHVNLQKISFCVRINCL